MTTTAEQGGGSTNGDNPNQIETSSPDDGIRSVCPFWFRSPSSKFPESLVYTLPPVELGAAVALDSNPRAVRGVAPNLHCSSRTRGVSMHEQSQMTG